MRTKLSLNISLGSPIALAFGCFTSLYKRDCLKKPNDFGLSNPQARVYLFAPQTNKLF
ncbi:hypothetical protein HPHPP16_1371 [Helicobacter pylori Hp P-16]|nr:hypothetical protein HPHPP16_1371 [Helicobacter pylori Hp P-16]